MTTESSENKLLKAMICIDGSEIADAAFAFYLKSIHNERQEAHIVHVSDFVTYPALPYMSGAAAIDQEVADRKVAHIKGKNKEIADKYKKKCTDANINFKMHTICGEIGIGQAAVQFSKENDIQVIITGTRGLGTVRRTLLGSVSDYILHHSSVPVIIVPMHK